MLGGTAAEFERDVPFGVWVDAVDEHVACCDPHQNWDAALLTELEGVLPAARVPGANGDSTVADERYRAHRAMRGVLELIAEDKPLRWSWTTCTGPTQRPSSSWPRCCGGAPPLPSCWRSPSGPARLRSG